MLDLSCWLSHRRCCVHLALCTGLVPMAAHSEENLPSCSDLEVIYSKPTLIPLRNRVVVRRLPRRPTGVREEKDAEFKPRSPQGTSAFNSIRVADTTNPGLYMSSIEVFTLTGKSLAWRIDVIDSMDSIPLQWLNEDLLLLRVWWGRIVSTDLIFQISSGKFIYAKEANYGPLSQPCNEPGLSSD